MNKAVYTAIIPKSRVGGQGLYLRSLLHLGRSSEAKDRKNPKKVKCDGLTDRGTDGPTDGRTDGPTKRVVESRSTRLKKKNMTPCHLLPQIFLTLKTIKFLILVHTVSGW